MGAMMDLELLLCLPTYGREALQANFRLSEAILVE